MRHSKSFFFFGLLLIILPFTGLPLSWKHGTVVAIGVVIIVIAIFEQIASAVEDRESSFKRLSVERDESGDKDIQT
jgi:VIT1/CCC1 family predicted Fe2+/Mn2+ transporter